MVFQNIRTTRLKNHIIDFNDNTIINFPFGKQAGEIANNVITNAEIATDANIDWTKVSKSGSKLSEINDIAFTNLQQNQILSWDGDTWINTDLPSQTNPFDPNSVQTFTNKTIAASNNTLTGVVTPTSTDILTGKTMDYTQNTFQNFPLGGFFLPDGTTTTKPKIGVFYGGQTQGDFMFNNLTINGTFTTSYDTGDLWSVFTTAASDAALGGISTPVAYGRRDNNTIVKVRFKTTVTTERLWIGLTTDSTQDVNTDTHLNSKSGAAIMFSDVINNYTAQWNNGNATAQTFTHTAIDTSPHTVKFELNNSAGSIKITFDGSVIVNSTTQVPAATTALYFHCNGESIGSTGPPLNISYAYLLNDH